MKFERKRSLYVQCFELGVRHTLRKLAKEGKNSHHEIEFFLNENDAKLTEIRMYMECSKEEIEKIEFLLKIYEVKL